MCLFSLRNTRCFLCENYFQVFVLYPLGFLCSLPRFQCFRLLFPAVGSRARGSLFFVMSDKFFCEIIAFFSIFQQITHFIVPRGTHCSVFMFRSVSFVLCCDVLSLRCGFYLPSRTSRALMSAGETPGMREACARVSGFLAESF